MPFEIAQRDFGVSKPRQFPVVFINNGYRYMGFIDFVEKQATEQPTISFNNLFTIYVNPIGEPVASKNVDKNVCVYTDIYEYHPEHFF